MSSMRELPDWAPGTVCVLSTGGGAPHAIPVSTAVRAGPRRVLLALAARRETLARLRREPRCALTVMAAGDVACTIHARAEIVAESLPGAEGVAAVSLDGRRDPGSHAATLHHHGGRRVGLDRR